MRLHTDAVDVVTAGIDILAQFYDSIALLHIFVVVVIVELAALRRILLCKLESGLDERVVTEDLHPRR